MQLVFTRSEIYRPEVFRRDLAIGGDRESGNDEWPVCRRGAHAALGDGRTRRGRRVYLTRVHRAHVPVSQLPLPFRAIWRVLPRHWVCKTDTQERQEDSKRE